MDEADDDYTGPPSLLGGQRQHQQSGTPLSPLLHTLSQQQQQERQQQQVIDSRVQSVLHRHLELQRDMEIRQRFMMEQLAADQQHQQQLQQQIQQEQQQKKIKQSQEQQQTKSSLVQPKKAKERKITQQKQQQPWSYDPQQFASPTQKSQQQKQAPSPLPPAPPSPQQRAIQMNGEIQKLFLQQQQERQRELFFRSQSKQTRSPQKRQPQKPAAKRVAKNVRAVPKQKRSVAKPRNSSSGSKSTSVAKRGASVAVAAAAAPQDINDLWHARKIEAANHKNSLSLPLSSSSPSSLSRRNDVIVIEDTPAVTTTATKVNENDTKKKTMINANDVDDEDEDVDVTGTSDEASPVRTSKDFTMMGTSRSASPPPTLATVFREAMMKKQQPYNTPSQRITANISSNSILSPSRTTHQKRPPPPSSASISMSRADYPCQTDDGGDDTSMMMVQNSPHLSPGSAAAIQLRRGTKRSDSDMDRVTGLLSLKRPKIANPSTIAMKLTTTTREDDSIFDIGTSDKTNTNTSAMPNHIMSNGAGEKIETASEDRNRIRDDGEASSLRIRESAMSISNDAAVNNRTAASATETGNDSIDIDDLYSNAEVAKLITNLQTSKPRGWDTTAVAVQHQDQPQQTLSPLSPSGAHYHDSSLDYARGSPGRLMNDNISNNHSDNAGMLPELPMEPSARDDLIMMNPNDDNMNDYGDGYYPPPDHGQYPHYPVPPHRHHQYQQPTHTTMVNGPVIISRVPVTSYKMPRYNIPVDTWWPSNGTIKRERRMRGYKSEDDDASGEAGEVRATNENDNEHFGQIGSHYPRHSRGRRRIGFGANCCFKSSALKRERAENPLEPGVLEKIPHCRIHSMRQQQLLEERLNKNKNNDGSTMTTADGSTSNNNNNNNAADINMEPLFCWQVTENYPTDVMVCCSICFTWRHAFCGGHHKYTGHSTTTHATSATNTPPSSPNKNDNDDDHPVFTPICDRCHAERTYLSASPRTRQLISRQRLEHHRRSLATTQVIRQAAYAKHGGTYKWPLGSVSATHIGGHTRSVHARHERSEKQWSEMSMKLGNGLGYRPKERVKVRTRELERLLVHVEDAELYTDRHNIMLFLQRDVDRKHPAGYEKHRRNFFDPDDDEQYFASLLEDEEKNNNGGKNDTNASPSQSQPPTKSRRQRPPQKDSIDKVKVKDVKDDDCSQTSRSSRRSPYSSSPSDDEDTDKERGTDDDDNDSKSICSKDERRRRRRRRRRRLRDKSSSRFESVDISSSSSDEEDAIRHTNMSSSSSISSSSSSSSENEDNDDKDNIDNVSQESHNQPSSHHSSSPSSSSSSSSSSRTSLPPSKEASSAANAAPQSSTNISSPSASPAPSAPAPSPPRCARQDCQRKPRFDSLFCSDSCGVNALERDLINSLEYASIIHPSLLRS